MRCVVRCLVAAALAAAAILAGMQAQAQAPLGVAPGASCTATDQITESISGRGYLLDFPCDLHPGEKLVFILLLHGAGSYNTWVRSYFPAVDFKEKFRLVIATPAAGSDNRIWNAGADDAALKNVAEDVFARFGKGSIRSFWLAGHSQGGITATRVACNDYFAARLDGLLSLSGGRIGATQLAADFFDPPPGGMPAGATAPPSPASGAAQSRAAAQPRCDFSYIYAVGEHEIGGLPEISPWADKYRCGPRQRQPDVVDERAGNVTGAGQPRNASYGRLARPGTTQVFVYPGCRDGRLVADVMRLDKGHTEGLEPRIAERIIQLMVAAPHRVD